MSVAAGWPEQVVSLLHPRAAWARELPRDREAASRAIIERAKETRCENKPMLERASARLQLSAPPAELGDEEDEIALAYVVADTHFVLIQAGWVVSGLARIVDYWVAMAGVRRAAELVVALTRGSTDLAQLAPWPAWERLGWHIASSSPEEAASSLGLLRDAAAASAPGASVRAAVPYLDPASGEADRILMSTEGGARLDIPFRRAVAAVDSRDALEHLASHGSFVELMLSTVLWKDMKRLTQHEGSASPLRTTLTIVARFGDAAIAPLLGLYARTPTALLTRVSVALVEGLGNLGTEAAFDVLVPAVRTKKELAALEGFALRSPRAAHASISRALASPLKRADALRQILAAIEAGARPVEDGPRERGARARRKSV